MSQQYDYLDFLLVRRGFLDNNATRNSADYYQCTLKVEI